MKHRIDVHLLTLNEPEKWFNECVDSLSSAPINLHVLKGIPGKIGLARCNGFRLGSSPYVSFVDPDDTYCSTAFDIMATYLDTHPACSLVYTLEKQTDEHGKLLTSVQPHYYSEVLHRTHPSHIHGLWMTRRILIEPVLHSIEHIPIYAEWLLTLQLTRMGTCIRLPIIGRFWRQHDKQAHKMGDLVSVYEARKYR